MILPSDDDGAESNAEALPPDDDLLATTPHVVMPAGSPNMLPDDDDGPPPLCDNDGVCLPCQDNSFECPLPCDDDGVVDKLCCKRKCSTKPELFDLVAPVVKQLKQLKGEQNQHLLTKLVSQATDVNSNSKRANWFIGNVEVCFPKWCALHGLSTERVARHVKSLRKTNLPPVDLRRHNKGPRAFCAPDVWTLPSQRCDAFLSFMYCRWN